MREDLYWEVVNTTLGLSADRQAKRLKKELNRLPPQDLYEFLLAQGFLLIKSKTEPLWMAACLLNGVECGDRCFRAFRLWLLFQGRELFEAAVADPDVLADREFDFEPERGEKLADAAGEVLDAPQAALAEQQVVMSRMANNEEDPVQDEHLGLMYWKKPTEASFRLFVPSLWGKLGKQYERGDVFRMKPDRIEFVESLSIKGLGTVFVGDLLRFRPTDALVLVKGLAVDRNDSSPDTYVAYVAQDGYTQRQSLSADRFAIEPKPS